MTDFENDIERCIATMNVGGTFLYPTDTIWGLGCDATDTLAIDKISEIKNRPEKKSYIVLVADAVMLQTYLSKPIPVLEALLKMQKGPTTIIYENIVGIGDNALAADKSLGIRIPSDDFCQALLRRYGRPIISTSANLSGEANPSFYKEIDNTVKSRVDYTCLWRQDDEVASEPSSIIKLNADGSLLKIR